MELEENPLENVLADKLALVQVHIDAQRERARARIENKDDFMATGGAEAGAEADDEGSTMNSPESSVFELSAESSPPSPMPGMGALSSAATTPLSCSPAAADALGVGVVSRSGSVESRDPADAAAGANVAANAKPSLRHAVTNTKAKRRGSSPTRARPSMSAQPTLQKIRCASTSAFAALSAGADAGSGEATPAATATPTSTQASSKSGRLWRMMSRRGSSSVGVATSGMSSDAGDGDATAMPPIEHRKSTLGRILEKSKSGLVGA